MKQFPKSVVILFLFLFITGSVSFVFAAPEGDSPEDTISAEKAQKGDSQEDLMPKEEAQKGESSNGAIRMEEVVVSATKLPSIRKDIPNAVVIKDMKDIQASGAKTIGELLAGEPGMDWQTYGNYGGSTQEIHIRGMRGNATQVLVNGVNVGSPSLGVADVGKIPVDNIERIETVKGSGSLLYGSGAMAGTVNIITREPSRDKMDLKVSAGYGTQNTYRLAAENGMFVVGDFGYYLTAGRTETDGFRDNSWLRQNDVSLKLLFDKKEKIHISLYGDYIDRSYGVPGVKPPAGTQDYYVAGDRFYNSESSTLLDHSSDKDGHLVLNVKGKPIKWFGYDLKGYYTNLENYNYARYAFDGTGAENWVTNRVLGTDGHLDIYPFDGAQLLLGFEYKDFNWKNQSYGLASLGLRDGSDSTIEAHVFTQGYFMEAEYRPFKYGKAFAGFRHEIHSAFGSENLPRIGMVINPFETTALKITHGKHFLAPALNDLYWPADPYNRGNPDLKPENGWHTDVTVEQSLFKDKLFMTISYFHWNVDDKIQWEPDSQGVWSPINLAGYTADGIEAGLKVGPFYGLSLGLSYTYTNAEEENRDYLRQDYGWPPAIPPDFQYIMVKRRATMTPENQFKGDLTYKSNFGLTATATLRYVGDQIVYNTETTAYPDTQTINYTIGSYWTADLKIEQRLFKHWILSLAGYNLFDREYDVRLQSFTDQTTFKSTMCGYPGRGRSVFGSVSYEF
ncbi:MAG: TonB-dependent receptor [Smithellaceae bacterium]|nr:TonB-dependent receptor [Smithellaceae bacterium]